MELRLLQSKQLRMNEPHFASRKPQSTDRSDAASEPLRTVLVADDEDSVRDLTADILESAGFRVISARNGREALEAARNLPADGLHLLVTDIVMPGMNGAEAARAILQIHPRAAVLFVSGCTEAELRAGKIELAELLLLPKPFTRSDLLRAADRALAGRHPPDQEETT